MDVLNLYLLYTPTSEQRVFKLNETAAIHLCKNEKSQAGPVFVCQSSAAVAFTSSLL